VDESQRNDHYFLTAVILRSSDVGATSLAIRKAIDERLKGGRRSHFSSGTERGRRQILDAYCRLPVDLVIAVAEYRGGDDQVARDRCLRALLGAIGRFNVRDLTLDSRGEVRDALDRKTIRGALPAGYQLTYRHQGSRDVLLLSLPDAFGWAYGAGGTWRGQVTKTVQVHELEA